MTPSGIEPTTFRLVAQSLNKLCHRVPQMILHGKTKSYAILSCSGPLSGRMGPLPDGEAPFRTDGPPFGLPDSFPYRWAPFQTARLLSVQMAPLPDCQAPGNLYQIPSCLDGPVCMPKRNPCRIIVVQRNLTNNSLD